MIPSPASTHLRDENPAPFKMTYAAAMLAEHMDSKDSSVGSLRMRGYADQVEKLKGLSLDLKSAVNLVSIAYNALVIRIAHVARILISSIYTLEHVLRGGVRILDRLSVLDIKGVLTEGVIKTAQVAVEDVITILGHVLCVFAPEVLCYALHTCRHASSYKFGDELPRDELKALGIYEKREKVDPSGQSVATNEHEQRRSLVVRRTPYVRPWVIAQQKVDLENAKQSRSSEKPQGGSGREVVSCFAPLEEGSDSDGE